MSPPSRPNCRSRSSGDSTWRPITLAAKPGAYSSTVAIMLANRRSQPWLAPQYFWPGKAAIDPPLVAGAALFGIGWGLVGLCPGPALESLATLSPGVVVFVVAMAVGMILHDVWQDWRAMAERDRQLASATDG